METKAHAPAGNGAAKINLPRWLVHGVAFVAVWAGALVFLDMPLNRYLAARDMGAKGLFSGRNLDSFQRVTNKLVKESILFFSTYNQTVPLILLTAAAAISLGRGRWRMLGHLLLGLGISSVLVWAGKLLICRQRPRWSTALHWPDTFKGFWPKTHTFETQSLPSGDAAVAFTVSFILVRYFPRHRWILYLLAAGCAATRMIRGYHYLSDVLLGCAIGYLAARIVGYLASSSPAPAGK